MNKIFLLKVSKLFVTLHFKLFTKLTKFNYLNNYVLGLHQQLVFIVFQWLKPYTITQVTFCAEKNCRQILS